MAHEFLPARSYHLRVSFELLACQIHALEVLRCAQLPNFADDLLRQARAEMRRILQDPDATLGEVETYLTRFADYPDDVQEARALLTSKRDAMADTASELLATLQHSNDIVAINEGLSKYSGSSDLVRSSVALVEKHRDDLCRAKA
eukprot:COSAG04_NODE_15450_length_531_cov_1.456019_1_plen_145_part_01